MFDVHKSALSGCWYPDGMDPRTVDVDGFVSKYFEALRSAITHPNPIKSLINLGTTYTEKTSRYGPVPRLIDDGATVLSREIIDAVSRVDEPFFLFANFMDAHGPHTPTVGYDSDIHSVPWSWASDKQISHIEFNVTSPKPTKDIKNYRELYGAAIKYLDRVVSSLVETLLDITDQETTVIVTADHGENLAFDADGGLIGHQGSLSEGLLHVPCYVVNPPVKPVELDHRYVSHLRLGELVTGIATGEVPDVSQRTIAAERIGTSAAENLPSEERRYWNRSIRCLYEGDSKTVWDSVGNIERYELDIGRPCWQRHVTDDADKPEGADSFFSIPVEQAKDKATAHDSNHNESVKGRLEDLGYLG